MNEPCPFCKGRGKISTARRRASLGLPAHPEGDQTVVSPCDPCAGTGDLETAKLMRAARLGETVGMSRALARLQGETIVPMLSWATISAAVIDELRSTRVREALMPGSREIIALEAEVERLNRERLPILSAFASFEAELAERLDRELPR